MWFSHVSWSKLDMLPCLSLNKGHREWVAEVTLTSAHRISVLPCLHCPGPRVFKLEPLASFSKWDVSRSHLCYSHAWPKKFLCDHSVLSSHAVEALGAKMVAPQEGRNVETDCLEKILRCLLSKK